MYLVWPDLPHSIGKPQKRSSTSGPTTKRGGGKGRTTQEKEGKKVPMIKEIEGLPIGNQRVKLVL